MSSAKNFQILSIILTIQGLKVVAKSSSYLILKNVLQILIASVCFICLFLSFYKEVVILGLEWIKIISSSGYFAGISLTYLILQSQRRSLNKFFLDLSQSYYFQTVFKEKPKVIFLLTLLTASLPYAISICDNSYYIDVYYENFILPQRIIICSIWIFIIDPINYFCVFLNIFICYILISMFERFKMQVKKVISGNLNHSTWAQLTKEFITQHKKLSHLVDDYNNIYANIYLIHFLFNITELVFLIKVLNLNHDLNEWKFSVIPSIFQYSCLFSLQILSIASVNSQVLSSIHQMQPQLLILSNYYEKTNPYTLFANSELSLYIQQVSLNPAALTVGNFFAINKGTLLSVGATVLTYILILYGKD